MYLTRTYKRGMYNQVIEWNMHMIRRLREHPWNKLKGKDAKNMRNAIACVCIDSLNGLDMNSAIQRAITWLKNHTSVPFASISELFHSSPDHLGKCTLSILNTKREMTILRLKYSESYYFQLAIPTQRALSLQQVSTSSLSALIERYSFIYTSPRFFWSISPDAYKVLENFSGDVVEAFASPFNNNLKGYCSLYPEDILFGALGNFFDVIASPSTTRKRWVINPPFTNTIFTRVHDAIVEHMKTSDDEYYFLMPEWPSSTLYQFIQHRGTMIKLEGGKYIIYDHLNNDYISPFVDMIFGSINGSLALSEITMTK